jgi:hypothetical protein
MRARSVDELVINEILKRTSGVVDIFRMHLVTTDSAVSLGNVINELAGPRNSAAHDGTTPSDASARKALDLAAVLLGEVSVVETPTELNKRVRAHLRGS